MKYIKIEKDNLVNGPGIRVVLWVSGCSNHCPGCHNPETWDPEVGEDWTAEAEVELFNELGKDYVAGLTLTGGDPFFPANRAGVAELVKKVKEKFPGKNIWAWTGYDLEYLFHDETAFEAIKNIDVIVDGRFRQDLRARDMQRADYAKVLRYRGSSNQRIIDVPATLNTACTEIIYLE